MTAVWVVEKGQYSDRRVVAVFDTKEAAEALANVDDLTITETELNVIASDMRPVFRARLEVTGTITVSDWMELHEDDTQVYWAEWSHPPQWQGRAFGATPEHARKNLADALAKAKAERASL